ncbi:conserved hypothetical protein [Gammaproteobacteria bacterium]
MTVAGVPSPAISIIIDDLGYQLSAGLRVVGFPGPLACSLIPYTPYAIPLAEAAYRAGKEVMLHLPMESSTGVSPVRGGLFHAMDHSEFSRVVRADLTMIPHVRGINNHMGSLLTSRPVAMSWLMAEIKRHDGLFFVDSRTTAATVALNAAREAKIAATRRDVFLDNIPHSAAVRDQFTRLVALAHAQGTAVGIAHPRPATLNVLADLLPRLATLGVSLIPISETIIRRSSQRPTRNPYGPLPDVEKISRSLK